MTESTEHARFRRSPRRVRLDADHSGGKKAVAPKLKINRAPVLTLWAAVVAERLGFDRAEALTLGRAVAGLNAYAKGTSLGLFHPAPNKIRQQRSKTRAAPALQVALLGRAVPVVRTPEGMRALSKNRPISAPSVARYLESKFGEALPAARSAMAKLARSRSRSALADEAYRLYAQFRPSIPTGVRGWGAKGVLDLARIAALAR